jgi:hypothetical protein
VLQVAVQWERTWDSVVKQIRLPSMEAIEAAKKLDLSSLSHLMR